MEEIKEMLMPEVSEGYQILVTGITWNKESTNKYYSKKDFSKNLPTEYSYTLPANIAEKETTQEKEFNDIVESYTYNLLTNKFNHVVYHCQIWLPLKTDEQQ